MIGKSVEKKTNLLISHNRILEVNEITEKEIKDGGKLNENENYRILDKDYGKSEELARMLLEKKKKMPTWLIVIILIFAIILSVVLLVIMYQVAMSIINKKDTPIAPITQNIVKPPQTPIIINENKKQEEQQIQEKENNIQIEYLKINDQYKDLQLSYELLLRENEDLKNKKCEQEQVEIVKEKELTEKEKFIFMLGQTILSKCDEIIFKKEELEKVKLCETIYSKFIFNLK